MATASTNVGIPATSYDQLPEAEFAFIKHDIPHTIDLLAEREVRRDGELAVLPRRHAAGQQPLDAADRHVLAGDEREREVLVDGDRVRLDRHPGDGEQLL